MTAIGRRRILITGGTDGIGLALARRLCDRHDVMVTGRRPAAQAKAVLPQDTRYAEADNGEPAASATRIADALLRAGWVKLDNAVLNAATGTASPNGIDAVADIRTTLDINLTATVLQARTLYPWLAKAGGTLTLTGSVAHRGADAFAAYAASKAGLHAFARALQSEWQGRVAVQIVHPGPTRTGMHDKAGYDPGRMRSLFIDAGAMAAMMEGAMASSRSPVTLSFGRYWSGGAGRGRKL